MAMERRRTPRRSRDKELEEMAQLALDTANKAYALISEHEKICAARFQSIAEQTSVLPAMKKQLDEQDQALQSIQSIRNGFSITRKTIAVVLAVLSTWSILNEAVHAFAAHWH